MRRAAPWAAVPLLALLGACHRDPLARLAKDPDVLAVVGRYYVSRSDLAAAIAFNQAESSQDPAVKSRILDGMVDSLLVLNDGSVAPQGPLPAPLGPLADPKAREEAVGDILQERVYSKVTVTPEEVASYYREHLDQYRRGRGVLLRQMLLQGSAQAADAERLLREHHSFVDVARLYSVSPDRGAQQYFQLDEIPDYLQGAVARARTGVPTAPIEAAPDSYQILLVVGRYESYVLPLADVGPEIRLRLSDADGDRLYQRYLRDLRQRFRPVIFSSKLPFGYEKESP